MADSDSARLASLQSRIDFVSLTMRAEGVKITPRALSDVILAELVAGPDLPDRLQDSLIGVVATLNVYAEDGAVPDCFVMPPESLA